MICCKAHAALGNPLGCYLDPNGEIATERRARESRVRKSIEAHFAVKKAVADGMLPADYVIPGITTEHFDA